MAAAATVMESDESDPQHFLDSMEPLLGNGGCIKGVDEAAAIVQAMKNARLMVNKCLLLNIIKATTTSSTLESLMGLGGWSILNMWLSDSKKAQNIALLIQLMQVLMQLPVTLECLKQGNMGKLVKQLTKQENQEVKTLASELLTKWMTIFKQSKIKKEDENGDRASKRPRDLPSAAATHVPPDKKAKNSPTKTKINSSAVAAATGLTESTGFMNAISSQVAAVAKLKKPKRAPPKQTLQSTTTTTTSVSSSSQSTSTSGSGNAVTDVVDNKSAMTTAMSSKDLDNPQSTAIEKSKAKKRVSFASDDVLTEIFYFEMDESERSVMRSRNFMDAAQAEKMREREAMENVKLLYHDNMIEMTPWVRPSMIDGVTSLVNPGCMSEQKRIQVEREQRVLAELFLDKKSLPFSPAEPDPETSKDETEPKQIPLWEPGMEPPQELSMLPPGGPLPGADMNTPYNQQHLQQGGLPLSPGIEPNPSIISQPQLPVDHSQPYFHGVGPDGQEWRPHPQGGFSQHRGPPPPIPPGSHNWGVPRGSAERGGRVSRQVCKHYASHGCRLGAACRFLHPPEYNRNIRTNT